MTDTTEMHHKRANLKADDERDESIYWLSARIHALAGAIQTLSDRQVDELGINSLAEIEELARIIGKTAYVIMEKSEATA